MATGHTAHLSGRGWGGISGRLVTGQRQVCSANTTAAAMCRACSRLQINQVTKKGGQGAGAGGAGVTVSHQLWKAPASPDTSSTRLVSDGDASAKLERLGSRNRASVGSRHLAP